MLPAAHPAQPAENDPLGFVPEPGMIVWCLVPEGRQPIHFPPPGPKYRPAFIKTVLPDESGHPLALTVIPGTSKPPSSEVEYPWDFVFDQNHRNFGDSGLDASTRFKTNRIVSVPFTLEYFGECAPGASAQTNATVGRKSNALMGHAFAITAVIEKAFSVWANEVRRRKAR